MSGAINAFRQAVGSLADQWLAAGLPSRQKLVEQAEKLDRLREHLKAEGIWEHPPCMLTATLDDGLGQGLAIIEKYALAMGMRLISLGLMQTPQAILDACLRHQPDYLGLTILQWSLPKICPAKRASWPGGRFLTGIPISLVGPVSTIRPKMWPFFYG